MKLYSRPIRLTATGTALDRPCVVSGITIVAVSADTLIDLRDGGAGGQIVWSGEADNAASSFGKTFDPPLKFFHNLHVTLAGGAQSSVSLEVREP